MPGKLTGRRNGQRGADIAATVRGAFLRAAKMSEEDGRPLSLILYDQLQKNPLDTLRVMGQFIPKEMLVEAQVTTDIEAMSDAELAAYARRLTADLGLSVGIAGAAEATH